MGGNCEIYSDESGFAEDRFEAIGTVSGSTNAINGLRTQLSEILERHGLSHCEYKEVSGGKRYNCAIDCLQALHAFVVRGDIKVMVLVWDKHDSRHAIAGRDDHANMSIMYYRALKTTKRLWRDTTIDTEFYPDELLKIDFGHIIRFIEGTRIRDKQQIQSLFGVEFRQMFPTILSHRECVSTTEPIIQLIDLVTGIVRLSYEEKNEFDAWRIDGSGQIDMFGTRPPSNVTKKKTYKYQMIDAFDGMLKGNTMRVGLKSSDGFHSHQPSTGYFFWKYAPQHTEDKAPLRSHSRTTNGVV